MDILQISPTSLLSPIENDKDFVNFDDFDGSQDQTLQNPPSSRYDNLAMVHHESENDHQSCKGIYLLF